MLTTVENEAGVTSDAVHRASGTMPHGTMSVYILDALTEY